MVNVTSTNLSITQRQNSSKRNHKRRTVRTFAFFAAVVFSIVPFLLHAISNSNATAEKIEKIEKNAEPRILTAHTELVDSQTQAKELRKQVEKMLMERQNPHHSPNMDDGIHLISVKVAHHPRHDQLGSFTLPTVYLLSIANRYGWKLEIFPYKGSSAEDALKHMVNLGPNVQESWGTGLQDSSHRKDFNPMELNDVVYDNLGFFPKQSERSAPNETEWVDVEPLPAPGPELERLCRNNAQAEDGVLTCRIKIPLYSKTENTYLIQEHIEKYGGPEVFFTDSFRATIRKYFFEANRHHLKHYSAKYKGISSNYNIAIHIRRGDIPTGARWIDQSVFATVARSICEDHAGATVHIFSSGKNRDDDWHEIERIAGDKCGGVIFHFDENEFVTWAHMVAADALIMSKSTFSYVPALISGGDVYFPEKYWHFPLSHWHTFRKNGEVIKRAK